MKIFVAVLAVVAIEIGMLGGVEARSAKDAKPAHGGTILFVPQDDRPTSYEQSAAAAQKLGYTVLMPPKTMLGGLEAGEPDALWQWAEARAGEEDAAVV